MGERLVLGEELRDKIGKELGIYGTYHRQTGASCDDRVRQMLREAGINRQVDNGDEYYVIAAPGG